MLSKIFLKPCLGVEDMKKAAGVSGLEFTILNKV